MATEKRLIDANAFYNRLRNTVYDIAENDDFGHLQLGYSLDIIAVVLKQTKTVEAVEVVHGRWKQASYTEAPLYICSGCGKPEYKQHNYCPNCGAKMDGDGNGLVR